MECRARKPLEHVEIRFITDKANPCFGARGLFAKTEIPKGRIVCPYMGLYRQQTDSFSHYIFNLDLDIPMPGRAAAKKVLFDVDSRASCIGNESKFINDGICLSCIKAIQTENSEDELVPKSKRRWGTRWFGPHANPLRPDCTCKDSNVVAASRLNTLLGIPYIAIIATKSIKKNEELLLNYGEQYWAHMLPEEVNIEGKRAVSDISSAAAAFSTQHDAKKAHAASSSSSAAAAHRMSLLQTVPEN